MNSLLLTLFSICLIIACDVTESNPELQEVPISNPTEMEHGKKNHLPGYQKPVPFKATFFTLGVINEEDPSDPEATGPFKGGCTEVPFILFNVQEGYGQATHLGRFSTRITFCADITDVIDDGTLTGDESLPYNNGQGTFKAANGDELYFTIEGTVLPSDHPDYNLEFQDPFTFTGGTGRFAGASGSGITDSFVNQSIGRTDHSWNGKLFLNPKKITSGKSHSAIME